MSSFIWDWLNQPLSGVSGAIEVFFWYFVISLGGLWIEHKIGIHKLTNKEVKEQ